jgi:hypothetical protein
MIKAGKYLLIILAVSFGCVEVYQAKTDFHEDVPIVNGLITNNPEYNYIQITLSSKEGKKYLSNANVYVTDDDENITFFNEVSMGLYKPVGTFSGEIGKTYRLNFITDEGIEYESSPQIMIPPVEIDSIYGEKTEKIYYNPSATGGYVKNPVRGLDVFGDFSNSTEELPRFRMDISLLLLYGYEINEFTRFFCWKKSKRVEILNLSSPKFDIGNSGIRKHSICFLPQDKNYYELLESEYYHKFILIIRQFRLNKDAYDYYSGVLDQLTSEGKLFDPAANQLNGNIKCKSDPKQLVLGFFEVSSTHTESFRLTSSIYSSKPHFSFIKIPDLEAVSQNHCQIHVPPFFWSY